MQDGLRGGYAPTVVLIGSVIALAGILHFGEPYIGPLALPRPMGDYGRFDADTAGTAYPRHANDAGGHALSISGPGGRIASADWIIDEFVYTVAPPQHVSLVSPSAYDQSLSNVYKLAEQFRPGVAANAEIVLKAAPDLILQSSDSSTDLADILRSAGSPIFRMYTLFRTLDEVRQSILLTGYLTGYDDEAQRASEVFTAAIERARSRKPPGAIPPRILGYAGPYSYGDETLFDDVVQTLGAVNIGAENGLRGYDAISSEQVVRWDPEWIVAGAARGETEAMLRRMLEDPAIRLTTAARRGQIVVFDYNVFLPLSPFTALLLDELGDALYPGTGG